VSPSLSIPSVLVAWVSNESITVLITLHESQKNREPVKLEALLDSGAGGLFIDTTFVKENEFTLCDLPEPLNAYNVDGTLNKKGTINVICRSRSSNRRMDHKDTVLRHWIRETKGHFMFPLVTRREPQC
jgi:hypothetical protein